MPKGKGGDPEKDMLEQDRYESAQSEFRELAISVRVVNTLVANGISSVKDLQSLNESELEQLPGIGPKALESLKAFVRGKRSVLDGQNYRLVSVKFSGPALMEIDKWALEQKGVISRAEAIRRLVELGLLKNKN